MSRFRRIPETESFEEHTMDYPQSSPRTSWFSLEDGEVKNIRVLPPVDNMRWYWVPHTFHMKGSYPQRTGFVVSRDASQKRAITCLRAHKVGLCPICELNEYNEKVKGEKQRLCDLTVKHLMNILVIDPDGSVDVMKYSAPKSVISFLTSQHTKLKAIKPDGMFGLKDGHNFDILRAGNKYQCVIDVAPSDISTVIDDIEKDLTDMTRWVELLEYQAIVEILLTTWPKKSWIEREKLQIFSGLKIQDKAKKSRVKILEE